MVLRIIVKIITLIIFSSSGLFGQNSNTSSNFRIGLVEYEPGDWNSDQTALAELLYFINQNNGEIRRMGFPFSLPNPVARAGLLCVPRKPYEEPTKTPYGSSMPSSFFSFLTFLEYYVFVFDNPKINSFCAII